MIVSAQWSDVNTLKFLIEKIGMNASETNDRGENCFLIAAKKGKIEMMIPYQLDSICGKSGIIENLVIKNMDGGNKELKVDYFLPFFGLSTNLGPIKDWELELEKNILKVKQETCETNLNGIFAIGDVCSYPGKLKLILTGFAEAAIASHNCYNKINPDKTLHFEYSTTKGINKL